MATPGAISASTMMASETPVAVGDTIAGKYRVVRPLGAGGMGVVVQAEHLELGQPVALKFLRASAAADPSAAERFLREARAAVRIRSEHVARVLDVGRIDDGTPFMVIEYLDGRDLGVVIASEAPLPIAVAAGYVLQACEAIAEAHALGIMHRDLKPSNVFVSRRADGTPLVKVLDFGISKAVESEAPGSSGTPRSPRSPAQLALTTTGMVLGSPLYMSPEQLRNTRAVDTRTDIWSLGIILHELLTRRPAFEADSMPSLCAMIVTDPPCPLRALRPDAPAALEAVVAKCLEKEPAARFRTVADFARALLPFAGPEGRTSVDRIVRVIDGVALTAPSPRSPGGPLAPAVAPPRRPRRGLRGALVLGTSIALMAFAIVLARRAARETPAASMRVAPPPPPIAAKASSKVADVAPPASSAFVPVVPVLPELTDASRRERARTPRGHQDAPAASSAASASSPLLPAQDPGDRLDPLVDQR